MFLDLGEIIVNLDNVVSIKVEKEIKKIIFNLNYSVSIDKSSKDITPDYIYHWYSTEMELKEILEVIKNYNFITFENSDNPNSYINLKNVSSIKEYNKDGKNRLIFNLNVSNTIKKFGIVSSYAIYYDFDNEEDFQEASITLNTILNSL